MLPILDIVNKYRLFLIEDCAQSHGAQYFKKHTGTFGDYGCFSFYPTKNLGGFGDGGLITSNIRKNIEKVKKLRNYGFKEKNITEYLGFNSRLDDLVSSKVNQVAKLYLSGLVVTVFALPHTFVDILVLQAK